MQPKGFKFLLLIKVMATLPAAVLFMAIPALVFSFVGLELSSEGVLLSQLFGALLFGVGLQLFCSRNEVPSKALGASLLVTSIGDFAALYFITHAQLTGMLNPLGWALVAIYALSACFFACYGFAFRSAATV